MYIKPNSKVLLLTGIDLDNNYTNTLFWENSVRGKQQQETFFTSKLAYTFNNPNLRALSFDYLYYVRNNSFKVDAAKDALFHVNYLMFKNINHSPKWFYAFVTDIKYINETTSEIFYQVDVIQSWYFDYTVLPSFVMREHVAYDTIGLNTVEENLPVPAKVFNRISDCSVQLGNGWSSYNNGSNVVQYNVGLNRFFKEYAVIVPSTVKLKWGEFPLIGDLTITDETVRGYFYNGIYSGLNLNLLRKYKVGAAAVTYGEATMIIQGINQIVNAGGEDTITGVYMVPIMFAKKPVGGTLSTILNTDMRESSSNDAFDDWFHIHNQEELNNASNEADYFVISASGACIEYKVKFPKGITWQYYDKLNGNGQPKNNKLYTFPFTKLLITDNAGNSGELRFERFKANASDGIENNECSFKIACSVVPNPLAQTMPLNYCDVNENVLERVTTENFPKCAWSVSSFEAWIGKNKTNIIMDTALNAMGIPLQGIMALAATGYTSNILRGALGAGAELGKEEIRKQAITGGNVGMLRGTNKFIGNLESNIKNAATALDMPPRAKGESYNSIIFATGKSGFQYYTVRPTDEYCNIIDRYFDMYGYAVKDVKAVKRRNRKLWTYVQTNKCAVSGNLNQDILSEIEDIYNNGITFWVVYDNGAAVDLRINDYSQIGVRQNTPLEGNAES